MQVGRCGVAIFLGSDSKMLKKKKSLGVLEDKMNGKAHGCYR